MKNPKEQLLKRISRIGFLCGGLLYLVLAGYDLLCRFTDFLAWESDTVVSVGLLVVSGIMVLFSLIRLACACRFGEMTSYVSRVFGWLGATMLFLLLGYLVSPALMSLSAHNTVMRGISAAYCLLLGAIFVVAGVLRLMRR